MVRDTSSSETKNQAHVVLLISVKTHRLQTRQKKQGEMLNTQ